MRLAVLDHGHRLRARLFFTVAEVTSRVPMSDVPKTLLYRPEFLGSALLDLSAEMMRGPSFWTAGEREYMAMSTAQLLQCPFCVESHAELTRIASTGEIDAADPGSARPELTAALEFLEKVTTAPDRVGPHGLPQGVPDAAVIDALHVNLIWNIVNRLANAFDFQLREGQLEKGTRSLHRFGYRFPGFLTGGTAKSSDRRSGLVANLHKAVFDSPAITDPATRAAAANGAPLPQPWESYAAKVRDTAFQVTDTDISGLKAIGHSEDEIFEITVAAAVGAALRCLNAGLAVLRTGPESSS